MRILWCLLGLLLAGESAHAAKVQVFSCEPEWAALARQVGGERVEVYSATTAQQDVHYIQARPSLISRLRKAQLLVCTGAGLESAWLPVLQRRANNPAILDQERGYLEMADHMELRERPVSIDRSQGDVHPEGNPHFHLDPRNLLIAARVLSQRLTRLDPAGAEAYQQAYMDFSTEWQQALDRWHEQAATLRGMKVVAHHLDWNYLMDWLGMDVLATLEPKPGLAPSSQYLSELVNTLQQSPPACILRTVYQSHRPAQWLAARVHNPVVELPHTVTEDEVPELSALFDEILQRLQEQCR